MSGIFNKLFTKILIGIVVLLLIVGFGSAITEDGKEDAFDAAVEELPFAGPISKVIVGFMKLDKGEALVSADSILTDVLKILVIALVRGPIVRFLFLTFAKVPGNTVDEREQYMETLTYRIKELCIMVLTAIPIAFLAGIGVSAAKGAMEAKLGAVLTTIILVAALLVMLFISVRKCMGSDLSFGVAFGWRTFDILYDGILKTMVTNTIAIWMYLFIKQGKYANVLALLGLLFFLLVLLETVLYWVYRALTPKR